MGNLATSHPLWLMALFFPKFTRARFQNGINKKGTAFSGRANENPGSDSQLLNYKLPDYKFFLSPISAAHPG